MREVAGTSKVGYFKALKAAKNKHWSSFLLTATPQSLWTAKRFAYGCVQPCFPSLPGAETRQHMNEVLLDYFFPPEEPFAPLPRLRSHKSVPPLTTEDVPSALFKCSPTAAPGPDGTPYSTWKQVNKINPSILLQILHQQKKRLLETHRYCVRTQEIRLEYPVRPARPQMAPAQWLHPSPLGAIQPTSCPPSAPGWSISLPNLSKKPRVSHP